MVVIVARPSKKSRKGSRAASKGPGKSGAARRKRGPKKTAPQGVEEFARGLAETERIALIVRDELFGGSWDNMQRDLEARAAGRPFVFRLASRIDEDLKAVAKLSAFERRRKVNLAEYLREGQ
ncbi:MAG: hypothetical protein ACYTKD_17420 [Planctomycetota bacterium]